MRSALTTIVGLALFTAACGGGNKNTDGSSAGSTTGEATTGGSTSGGSSGGTTGTTTTGGTTNGGLRPGAPCSADSVCNSGVCGITGSGNCCSVACTTTIAPCAAIGCDELGSCIYPVEDAGAILCGGTCSNDKLIGLFCDTAGACSASTGVAAPCAGNYACADGAHCKTTCAQLSDCAKNFNCVGGSCVAQLSAGPCTEDDACLSLHCDIHGSGNCCKNACTPTTDPACNATACDATTAACVYPAGNACGGQACVNSKVSGAGTCDTGGKCVTQPVACPNNLGCNAAGTDCNTSCTTVADCAAGFYCNNDAGGCVPQLTTGACFEDDECTSRVCGATGSGNCCTAACQTADPICGATDCDAASGACLYPAALCGTVAASCTAGVGQPASACDGAGSCVANPAPVTCTPFLCGASACLTSCTDASSCAAGAFCDVSGSACCDVLGAKPTISVDGLNGDDTKGCCGAPGNVACQTITRAMQLIDAAGATGATINATLSGGGGDWNPPGEVYPIVLGWGVELNAAGVNFSDSNGNGAVFDITSFSAKDTVGSASIAGTAQNPVNIGFTRAGVQSMDSSAIQVENGNTLFIANATVNGSAANRTNAITVVAGSTLMLGQDATAANTGTVKIGTKTGTDGWNGIVCTSTATLGCTISDAALTGISSVVIVNQENMDIDAEDNANITLTSAPTIGVAPAKVGFGKCATKHDGTSPFKSSGKAEAVLLNGSVSMTFSNGTVSCISGDGFLLQASSGGGLPNLTSDSTTIENTEYAIHATAGSATVTKATIQFNYNGVLQGTDGTNSATVDLSGGGNTLACVNSIESVTSGGLPFSNLTPAVVALNTTATDLAADSVDWDTTVPDQFSCDPTLTNCTCQSSSCADPAGADGMDAVYEKAGVVTTTLNGAATQDCSTPCSDPQGNKGTCPVGTQCCGTVCTFPCNNKVFCHATQAECQSDQNCFCD